MIRTDGTRTLAHRPLPARTALAGETARPRTDPLSDRPAHGGYPGTVSATVPNTIRPSRIPDDLQPNATCARCSRRIRWTFVGAPVGTREYCTGFAFCERQRDAGADAFERAERDIFGDPSPINERRRAATRDPEPWR